MQYLTFSTNKTWSWT